MIRSGQSVRDLLQSTPGTAVTAHGWVRTRRESKAVHFIQLNDGSSFADLQVVVPRDACDEALLRKVTTGASLRVEGELVASPAQGQPVELQARKLHLYGEASPTEYPLQKKGHSLEFLREVAHLRPRTNTFGAVFRVRNVLTRAIHDFFQSRGFLHVHTPLITASDCEGAGALFGVSTLDPENLPRDSEGRVDFRDDFFGDRAYLTVSGQLEGETFAQAFSNIYTFGPTFRAENSNTPRHLAEFWMIEPEMAFCDLDDDVELAEEFLKCIIQAVLNECQDDLRFFNERIDKTVIETLEHVERSPFARITYTDAIDILERAAQTWEFPVWWGCDLQSEHERYLTEVEFERPVVVTDYPRSLKPFYMRCNEDQKTVRAMDILAPRIGEIIGGSQREERLEVLRTRMAEQKLPEEAYWWYLDLRRFGTVPHAGFGLGLERMLLYVTGMKNIRDVIPFPRTPGHAKF